MESFVQLRQDNILKSCLDLLEVGGKLVIFQSDLKAKQKLYRYN
jgi:predicted SAM-dependent methyltransferase